MKYPTPAILLLVVLLAVVLSACSSGSVDSTTYTTATEATTPQVQTTPQPVVETPAVDPVVPSKEPVMCSTTVTTDCYLTFCPFSSEGCPASPYPYTPRPVETTSPSPTPVCVRDSTPLVFVDPFWVDNCGNKYGQVTI